MTGEKSPRARRRGVRSALVPRALGVLLFVAATVSLAVAPAAANHEAGGAYSGTHAESGQLGFSVSQDGSTLSSFGWDDLWGTSPTGGWCNSGLSTSFFFGAPPITDHSFNYSGEDFDATGSFPSPGTASGTVTLHTPADGDRLQCTSRAINWTAASGSATVSPPAPVPTSAQQFAFPAGATYKGTHASGGRLEFDVAVDSSRIQFIRFTSIEGTSPQTGSCSFTNTGQGWQAGEGPQISGGAWNYSNTDSFGNSFSFSGSFGSGPTASGTIGASFTDNQCTIGPLSWTATSGPPPPPTGGGAGGLLAPHLRIGGASTQKVTTTREVVVTVTCENAGCDVIVRGTISVPKLAKVYKLGPVFKDIGRGNTGRFAMKVSRSARRAIKRARQHGKKVKAKITILVNDGEASETTRTRSINLK
jgi:hypothetical protein